MIENSGRQLIMKIFILVLILVCIMFYFENLKMQDKLKQIEVQNGGQKDEAISQQDQKNIANVNIFDLSKPLEPANLYSEIQFRKSATYHVSTTLCVHNLSNDVLISGGIW